MLETDARDRVIVALDCDRERALELAHELSGHAAWLKVGMTLYYAEGPQIVKTFKDLGFKVFLDLKFHDIPHQVRGAARSASLAGADLLSVHGLGSGAMLAACHEGAEEARDDRQARRHHRAHEHESGCLERDRRRVARGRGGRPPGKARSGQRHRRHRVLADGGSRHA